MHMLVALYRGPVSLLGSVGERGSGAAGSEEETFRERAGTAEQSRAPRSLPALTQARTRDATPPLLV